MHRTNTDVAATNGYERHPLWLSGTGRFRSDSMSATHSRSSRTGFVTSYRWCASLSGACKWMCPHSAGRGAGRAERTLMPMSARAFRWLERDGGTV